MRRTRMPHPRVIPETREIINSLRRGPVVITRRNKRDLWEVWVLWPWATRKRRIQSFIESYERKREAEILATKIYEATVHSTLMLSVNIEVLY
jgi:hypothetical protein